ncbi:MAG: TPR domain-containing protein [Acidiferrobacter sp.]
MLVIFILAVFLLAFAVWFLTRPVRGRPLEDEGRMALEYGRDEILKHLQEIESDRQDGRVDETVAASEKARLEYELAQTMHQLDAVNATPAPAFTRMAHRGWVVAVLTVGLVVCAGGLDYWRNRPALLTFATLNAHGRVAHLHGLPPMVMSMVNKLKRHLVDHPDDTGGWLELARANVVLGNLKGAREAYAHAYKLAPADVNVIANYAWLLYTAHPTHTTGLVDTLYHRLYARDPHQQDALWFLGLAAYNRGHLHRTLGYWQRLLRELPPGSKARKGVLTAVGDVRKRLAAPPARPAPSRAPVTHTSP